MAKAWGATLELIEGLRLSYLDAGARPLEPLADEGNLAAF